MYGCVPSCVCLELSFLALASGVKEKEVHSKGSEAKGVQAESVTVLKRQKGRLQCPCFHLDQPIMIYFLLWPGVME